MKVLLIEDNPDDARLIQEMLKSAFSDFTFNLAEKLAPGLDFLASEEVDVVLLDPGQPDSRGLETLNKLQTRFSHLPVVIITSIDDAGLAAQAVRSGAQDYLVKSEMDSELLRRALIYAVERKRSETAILQSKEEWELTFNSIPDLIAILDCQHRVIRVNKAMAERLGVAPDKCVGLHCYEAVHGLTHYPEFCPHYLTCQDGKVHAADVREPRLGGDFLVSTSPIRDKQGSITGSVHVARDITKVKKAEADLLRLNRELRAISDCNQAIVRSTDEATLFTDVCHIMCNVVGYRMAWVGIVEYDEAKSIRPVAWHGDDGGYLAKAHITWDDTELGHGPTGIAARTGKTDFCQDFATELKTSPWREAALSLGFRSSIAIPLFDNEGCVFAVFTLYAAQPNGFIPAEVKLLEELAGDLAFGIRALHTKREHLRAEEGLRQRTVEIEAANKELEAFSYSVSHDLRAPLRSLDGFSQAVLEDYADKLDARGKEFLQRIRTSSQLMARLIDDILSLSRVTRAQMYVEETNLSKLAEEVAGELKRTQPERQVEFKITAGLIAYGDRNLLKLVLDNLLGNAFKFTEKNSHSVIEFGVTNDHEQQQFFIRDNGAGFDMNYADKLFKPFQRLHSGSEFPGTGIGLASVQRIINRHGGAAWAKGEKGKGATFYFTLQGH